MSIGRTDLNLIKVFDALYEERNVSRAARRLHLSPSAMSHALARLQQLVGEDLFVRTPRAMVPTPRATAIAQTLQASLRHIEAALGTEAFEPARAARKFIVAANDHMTAVIVSPLAQLLQREAPGVDLLVRPSTRLDLAEQIDIGAMDVVIGIFARVPERLQSARLFTDGEVVLMRKGHPAARRRLSLPDLAHYPLLAVAVSGQEEGAVDGFVLERGLARQVEMFDRARLTQELAAIGKAPRFRMLVPHSLAITQLLDESDMLAVVAGSLATPLCRSGHVVARPLPYESRAAVVRAVWHARSEHDPAHAWLRSRIIDIAATHAGAAPLAEKPVKRRPAPRRNER